jgi:hypothetical protein
MDLNLPLREKTIDPKTVIVMRHRPSEPQLRKVLPWLAGEKPDLFNAYQQTHGEKVEKAITRAKHVASFIAHGGGQAVFVGVYSVQGWTEIAGHSLTRSPRITNSARSVLWESPASGRGSRSSGAISF